jgi:AraC-like DNA-binding protein
MDHELVQRFFRATGIPAQLFDRGICLQSYGVAEPYTGIALSLAGTAMESGHPVCYTGSDEFLFCGLVRHGTGPGYFLLGPVAAFPCTHRQGQKILTCLGQPENRIFELLRWFKAVPLCDPQRFRELLLFLDYIVNGKTEHQAVFVPCRIGTVPAGIMETNLSFIEHFSELMDKKLTSAVEYGKTETIPALFNELESRGDEVPLVASNADQAYKNIFIFTTGVISRSAMRGGLDYITVTELSHYYLRRIEEVEGYTAIVLLFKQMFLDFAQRTACSRQLKTTSPLIRKINKVIMAHICEKTTPTGLSKIMRMNCSYLCRHFKQETGKTISEYINEMKITESKRLLESTELPLIQISTQLGFSSQNYFHTIFKRITGVTPGEYREGSKPKRHSR